jgi:endoglucanase
MNADALTFFKSLLATPSPSGYERPIQDVVRDYVASFADTVTTDTHGNVIVAKNPDAPMRVMLAGHCDQIGFLVTHIDKDGFIYLQPIGGWDAQVLLGQKLTIWSDDGPIFGVIARKPIHLLTPEQRKQVAEIKDLWLDIGAKDEADARAKVRIGDPVTLELGYHDMPNELASSPAMDNKAGLWVVIEALRRVATGSLKVGLFAVSTVQEEIGLRGARTSAYGIDPHMGVAVDVTHATDCPTIDKNQNGDIRLGKGPVIYRGPNMNPVVTQRLIDTAEAKKINFQLAAIGRATPNDANALQVTRAGMATGLVSIPNRYMHSPVEMISLPDMDRAADLLAETALSLGGEEDFTP